MCRTSIVAVAIVAGLTLLPAAARAQTDATHTPVAHTQVVSTNPFGLLLPWFNAEYERKIGPATTWGVGGSMLTDGGYANATTLLRFYPQRAAFDGIYLGVHAGVYRPAYRHDSSLGAGVDIGHAWLYGPSRNVSISMGFGLTRLVRADRYTPNVLPSARFVNVGIAF